MLLIFLIFFFFLIPEVYFRHFYQSETFSDLEVRQIDQYFKDIDSLEQEWEALNALQTEKRNSSTSSFRANSRSNASFRKKESFQERKPDLEIFDPFPFDPNQPDTVLWLKLGLKPRQIQTIINYLSKGGKFRFREDFRKIYGLREEQISRLEPYILLPQRDSIKITTQGGGGESIFK